MKILAEKMANRPYFIVLLLLLNKSISVIMEGSLSLFDNQRMIKKDPCRMQYQEMLLNHDILSNLVQEGYLLAKIKPFYWSKFRETWR